jgi:nucleoside-diphosphate-sugar epimerase
MHDPDGPRTALVTGANGFLGSHLVEHLLAEAWRVRALVRRTSDTRWLPLSGVERVYGEAALGEGLEAAVDGVDVVYHLAGVTRADSEEAYNRVNAMGTRHLVQAVRAAGRPVRRFVLVSSLAAGGPSGRDRPRGVDDPDRPSNAYGRSKKRGEEELIENAGGLDWTILRPPAVYGPRDRGFLVLARMAARGWVFRITGEIQPVNVVHVRDLVEAVHVASVSPAAVGRKYYVAHPRITDWGEMAELMARVRGRHAREVPVPRAVVPAVSRVAGIVSSLRGRNNPLPWDRTRDLLAEAWTCDPSGAATDFGFSAATDLPEGIRELMGWYAQEGWV